VYELRCNGFHSSWKARVELNRIAFTDGEELRLDLDLRVRSSFLREQRDNLEGLLVLAYGERLHDASGRFRQFTNLYMSTLLTPTGMPIENFQFLPPSAALDSRYTTPLDLWHLIPTASLPEKSRFSKQVVLAKRIEGDVPPGYYRIHIMVFVKLRDATCFPLHLAPFFTGKGWDFREVSYFRSLGLPNALNDFYLTTHQDPYLPLVRIGNPAPPRMIWTLFSGRFENGIHGIVADQDRPHFQLTSRSTRYPADFVAGPGSYRLEPDFPSVFRGNLQNLADEASTYPQFFPYDLRFDTGELHVTVQHPDGRVVDLGAAPFRRAAELGPTTDDERFVYDFREWGRYLVRMDGWIEDLHGNRLAGGGTYPLWIARPLTFSTKAKPGTPYRVGNRVATDLSIHPGMPAELEFKVTYFPYSDSERKITWTHRGTANRFGQFHPSPSADTMLFADPGEYRMDLTADYRDETGVLWHGNQTGAGVVAEHQPMMAAVGNTNVRIPGLDGEWVSEQNRFWLERETSLGFLFNNFTGCTSVPSPFFSGDVLFFSSTWGSSLCIEPFLSMRAAQKNDIAEAVLADFPRGTLSVNSIGRSWEELGREATAGRFGEYNLMVYFQKMTDAEKLPLLCRNRKGYQPFCYPEDNVVSSYFYFTAIRPGLIAYTQISDSTNFMNNWDVASQFGTQINAGPNGDLAGDVYRFYGGTVYRNREKNLSNYAAYASMAVVEPPGSYHNGVTAPADRRLFEMNGREYPLFMGMDVGGVYESGGNLGLGGMVFPAVPARVSFRVQCPDGRELSLAGQADPLGVFRSSETFRFSTPGRYRVYVDLAYDGKSGGLPGSSDGGFNLYAVEPGAPRILSVDLPPRTPVKPRDKVRIPLVLPDTVTGGEIFYSVFMPGILMDEGALPIVNGGTEYRFRPAQFFRQFPNYDIKDKITGEEILPDTVILVFFAAAKDTTGKPLYDATVLTLRDGVLWTP